MMKTSKACDIEIERLHQEIDLLKDKIEEHEKEISRAYRLKEKLSRQEKTKVVEDVLHALENIKMEEPDFSPANSFRPDLGEVYTLAGSTKLWRKENKMILSSLSQWPEISSEKNNWQEQIQEIIDQYKKSNC